MEQTIKNTTMMQNIVDEPVIYRPENELPTLPSSEDMQFLRTLNKEGKSTLMNRTQLQAIINNVTDATLRAAQEYADGAVADLINGSPAALDTLKELSDALGGDPNFATTVMQKIGERVLSVGNSYAIWCGNQAEYDAITNKDIKTLYFITE